MNFLRKIVHKLNLHSAVRKLKNLVPDEIYVKAQYKNRVGKIPNLRNPKTFNEKMCYLKLHNRDDFYSKLCDKYRVREYVKEKIGEEYLIPSYGCWNSVEEIDWNALPNQFVLKATHDSESVILCTDKDTFDIENAKKKLSTALSRNYFYIGREYPYKRIQPRVICEKLLDEHIVDYKFYVFKGEPKYLYVGRGLVADHSLKISFYDMNGKLAPFRRMDYPGLSDDFEMPGNFDEMKRLASKLAGDLPFVRIDLYSVGTKIYFSEITLTPASGYMPFNPEEYDGILGDMVEIQLN